MQEEERELWRRADDALARLLELPAPDRREALERMRLDLETRGRVEQLLSAVARDGGPLEVTAIRALLDSTALPDPPTLAGRRLGVYRLDEEIGRGGMAVVYRAHRDDGAFTQQVAVKLLGVGLLSLGAGERFRREQQLLARLRHPRIATMLDGGLAEDGTPYLVMELIDGRPIDRYAEENRLDTRARVALLLQVGGAVAFAHRNLVVHRDLKPNNILVDAAGEVKLLDFGIAKLLDAEPGKTPATLAQERFLTPGYAAPEQLSGGEVTTSTDVFGLGKVLEHLIDPADRTPGTDLANILEQALRTEPERRYVDARDLCTDLQNWLDGRPVVATPSSLVYRLGKALRRHRGRAAAALLVLAVAAAGLIATLRQAERARREERTATAVSGFLVGLFRANDPAESRGREVTVRELLERGVAESRRSSNDPALQVRLLDVLAGVYLSLGLFEPSAELWSEALERASASTDLATATREQLASMRDDLGVALLSLDRLDDSAAHLEQALAERRALHGEAHPAVGESLYHLAVLASSRGDLDRAERLISESLAIRRAQGTEGRADQAEALSHLGTVRLSQGRFPEAEAAVREALALHREVLGGDHPDVAQDLNALANVLTRSGRLDEAEPMMRDALALRRRLYEENHPLVAQTLNDLAVMLEHGGRLERAAEVYREALASYRGLYGANHQATLIVATNLGRLLLVSGEFTAAESLFRGALAALEGNSSGSERNRAIALAGLGEALSGAGRIEEAEAALRESLALAREAIRDPAFVAMAALELGRLEMSRGRPRIAEPLLAEAESGYRERYGAEHIRTARAASWLGFCRARLGRVDEGEALLRAALAVQSRALPPAHPHAEATRRHLAALGALRGELGESIRP